MTDEVKNFQKKHKDYIGLTYNEISLNVAKKIYEEYMNILDECGTWASAYGKKC